MDILHPRILMEDDRAQCFPALPDKKTHPSLATYCMKQHIVRSYGIFFLHTRIGVVTAKQLPPKLF